MSIESNRIPSLDGLRAISILLVIIGHLVLVYDIVVPTPLIKYLDLGPLGVRVFFVISGFLITTLLLRETETHGAINLKRFYYRRTLRIFPPFYFYLLVLTLLVLSDGSWIPADDGQAMLNNLPYCFLYLTNFSHLFTEGTWLTGHAWSLSIEEQFYLFWPFVILMFSPRKAIRAAGIIVVVTPIVGMLYALSHGATQALSTYNDAIPTGCLLAGLRHYLHQKRGYAMLLSSRVSAFTPFAVLGLYLLSKGDSFSLRVLPVFTAINFGIALTIDRALTHSDGLTGRVLNYRPLVFIGTISYSLYIWQQFCILPGAKPVAFIFPFNLVLLALLALVSYYFIERPVLNLRQKWEPALFPSQPINVLSPNTVGEH
jgi:peptidoglycan/LPS O-acetylase OafA/YrhL